VSQGVVRDLQICALNGEAMTDTALPPADPTVGSVADHEARTGGFAALGWKSRLRWFLAEFLVVVAGVLVALALTSWAQDRRNLEREQAYLRQLNADLQTSERILGETGELMNLRAEATARVLHRFWLENPVADDAFRDDLQLPRSTLRVRPVLGTAEALISSGDLNLIRSDALRAQLMAYVDSMKAGLEDISRYDETYFRTAATTLREGPDLVQFSKYRTQEDRLRPRPNVVERVPFPTTLAAMLNDRSVYNGYNALLIAHRNQAWRYGEMLEETRALRERVDAAIEK